jgi:hypothetical protein
LTKIQIYGKIKKNSKGGFQVRISECESCLFVNLCTQSEKLLDSGDCDLYDFSNNENWEEDEPRWLEMSYYKYIGKNILDTEFEDEYNSYQW